MSTLKVKATTSHQDKYQCTHCGREGHLVLFCFRKAKREKKDRLRKISYSGVEFGQAPYHRFAPSKQSSAGSGVFATGPIRPVISTRLDRRAVRPTSFTRSDRPVVRSAHQHRSDQQCPDTKSVFSLPAVAPVYRVSQYWIPKSYLTNSSTMNKL